jgi:hypothetical protein
MSAMTTKELKARARPEFAAEPEKFYPVAVFAEFGFSRAQLRAPHLFFFATVLPLFCHFFVFFFLSSLFLLFFFVYFGPPLTPLICDWMRDRLSVHFVCVH